MLDAFKILLYFMQLPHKKKRFRTKFPPPSMSCSQMILRSFINPSIHRITELLHESDAPFLLIISSLHARIEH